jgi:hypothetical protein
VHMALVQGIYDLGEPGREAKPMKLKRLNSNVCRGLLAYFV